MYRQVQWLETNCFACHMFLSFGAGELRATVAITDEGATSLIQTIGPLAVNKPITSHPCVGGWGRMGSVMVLLHVWRRTPFTAKPLQGQP